MNLAAAVARLRPQPRAVLMAAVCLLLLPSAAFPQGGPPLITDDPETPGNQRWEINVAVTAERDRPRWQFETPILDLNYGAGDHVQLKFEIPWVVQRNDGAAATTGLGNSRCGMKWRFLDLERHGVSLSTYPQLTFNNPTSSTRHGLADRGTQFLLPVEIAGKRGRFHWDGELGYNFRQFERDELFLGAAGGYAASETLELLAEIHDISDRGFQVNQPVFDLGGRKRLTSLYTLLFAAGRSFPGATDHRPQFFGYFGVQLTF